jgi:hypothetical protein
MAVGLELSRLTGLKLLHNHMAIELALRFFPYGSSSFIKLVRDIRTSILEEVAASSGAGLILTLAWDFDDPVRKGRVGSWPPPADQPLPS